MYSKVKITLQNLSEFLSKHKAIVITSYAFVALFAVYHIYFSNRIIPGVRIGNISLGGITYSQAKEKLQQYESTVEKKLSVLGGSDIFYIESGEIELVYNWDATVTRAFEVGRTGDFFTDNKDKLAGIIKGIRLSAFYEYDDALFTNELASIKGEVNKETKDASFVLNKDVVDIVPEATGQKVDGDKLFDDIMSRINNVDFSDIHLSIADSQPDLKVSDVEVVKEKVTKILSTPFVIKLEKREWKLEKPQLIELIRPKRESDGNVGLTLNKSKFEVFMETLSYEVGELPRGKVTHDDTGKVTSFEIVQQGKEIDSKEFTEQFKDALFNSKGSVALVLKEATAEQNKEKYGIVALLGEGNSKYTGSGASRVHNLTLAAERTSGVLVPPGAIYSFNKSIGEVSGRTGYDSAYIILGGKTVLGEGGGVCQTSTTLFRAVLNAGLPIVTRYPHAYRVVYYEQDRPVGFDAAVYQPSLDFQFRNDTSNYILVQAEPNPKDFTLGFRIYGTPDGRTVEITEPVVTNQTPPPAPLYQDDPNLKKGITRQVDFSAWGANVSFGRIVKKGDQVIYNDTFKSRYQPWRAVFLVGTKEN